MNLTEATASVSPSHWTRRVALAVASPVSSDLTTVHPPPIGPCRAIWPTSTCVSFNKPLHLLQLIAALLQETSPAARLWQDKSISSQLTQQASRYATGQRCIRATSHDRPAGFWPLNICRCLARRSEPGPP